MSDRESEVLIIKASALRMNVKEGFGAAGKASADVNAVVLRTVHDQRCMLRISCWFELPLLARIQTSSDPTTFLQRERLPSSQASRDAFLY